MMLIHANERDVLVTKLELQSLERWSILYHELMILISTFQKNAIEIYLAAVKHGGITTISNARVLPFGPFYIRGTRTLLAATLPMIY